MLRVLYIFCHVKESSKTLLGYLRERRYLQWNALISFPVNLDDARLLMTTLYRNKTVKVMLIHFLLATYAFNTFKNTNKMFLGCTNIHAEGTSIHHILGVWMMQVFFNYDRAVFAKAKCNTQSSSLPAYYSFDICLIFVAIN